MFGSDAIIIYMYIFLSLVLRFNIWIVVAARFWRRKSAAFLNIFPQKLEEKRKNWKKIWNNNSLSDDQNDTPFLRKQKEYGQSDTIFGFSARLRSVDLS